MPTAAAHALRNAAAVVACCAVQSVAWDDANAALRTDGAWPRAKMYMECWALSTVRTVGSDAAAVDAHTEVLVAFRNLVQRVQKHAPAIAHALSTSMHRAIKSALDDATRFGEAASGDVLRLPKDDGLFSRLVRAARCAWDALPFNHQSVAYARARATWVGVWKDTATEATSATAPTQAPAGGLHAALASGNHMAALQALHSRLPPHSTAPAGTRETPAVTSARTAASQAFAATTMAMLCSVQLDFGAVEDAACAAHGALLQAQQSHAVDVLCAAHLSRYHSHLASGATRTAAEDLGIVLQLCRDGRAKDAVTLAPARRAALLQLEALALLGTASLLLTQPAAVDEELLQRATRPAETFVVGAVKSDAATPVTASSAPTSSALQRASADGSTPLVHAVQATLAAAEVVTQQVADRAFADAALTACAAVRVSAERVCRVACAMPPRVLGTATSSPSVVAASAVYDCNVAMLLCDTRGPADAAAYLRTNWAGRLALLPTATQRQLRNTAGYLAAQRLADLGHATAAAHVASHIADAAETTATNAADAATLLCACVNLLAECAVQQGDAAQLTQLSARLSEHSASHLAKRTDPHGSGTDRLGSPSSGYLDAALASLVIEARRLHVLGRTCEANAKLDAVLQSAAPTSRHALGQTAAVLRLAMLLELGAPHRDVDAAMRAAHLSRLTARTALQLLVVCAAAAAQRGVEWLPDVPLVGTGVRAALAALLGGSAPVTQLLMLRLAEGVASRRAAGAVSQPPAAGPFNLRDAVSQLLTPTTAGPVDPAAVIDDAAAKRDVWPDSARRALMAAATFDDFVAAA